MATSTIQYPEHGDEKDWVILNEEETRCILGLKKYYMIFHSNSEETALEEAWIDLKREAPRLEKFTWFK